MSDTEMNVTLPDQTNYTHEQKIVSAVWVHERHFNNQSWADITMNFLLRFNTTPPRRNTLIQWEQQLFSTGLISGKERCGRPSARLMHVPYVKASLMESPELSLRERSKILGLPRTTLLKIINEDLNMEYRAEGEGGKHGGGGKWMTKNKTNKIEDETETQDET